MVGRGILLHKGCKQIDLSFTLVYTETCVPEPAHSFETRGTRDAGGHVLAMSLGPFAGSDELILDLLVIPCRRRCSLGSFASLFSFTPSKS